MSWCPPAPNTPQHLLQRRDVWQVSISGPATRHYPRILKQDVIIPRLARGLRRTVTIPQPWGSPYAGHGVRCDLTAGVWAYPRRSTHQVVVRARKMTPLVTRAAPRSKGRTRPHQAKHQWTEDMPGGIRRRANNQRACEA